MSNYSDFVSGGGGAGGINEIEIKPDEFIMDENDTDVDAGTIFDIFDTANFSPDGTGAIWFNFNMPDGFDNTKDVLFEINYALNGVDDSKSVIVNTEAWVVDETDAPTEGSPDVDQSDTITSSTTNTAKMTTLSLTNGKVANALIGSTTKRFSIKMTRDGLIDTYSGTFQLMSVRIYQV